jgi:hypothetical protein
MFLTKICHYGSAYYASDISYSQFIVNEHVLEIIKFID